MNKVKFYSNGFQFRSINNKKIKTYKFYNTGRINVFFIPKYIYYTLSLETHKMLHLNMYFSENSDYTLFF